MVQLSEKMRYYMQLLEMSVPPIVYHASDGIVKKFSISRIGESSLGFHFSETSELAINAAMKNGIKDPIVGKYHIAITNPLTIQGQANGFRLFSLIDQLHDMDVIDQTDYQKYQDAYDEIEENHHGHDFAIEIYKLTKIILKNIGRDSFKYYNEFDSGLNIFGTGQDVKPAWSWIVLDPKVINFIEILKS